MSRNVLAVITELSGVGLSDAAREVLGAGLNLARELESSFAAVILGHEIDGAVREAAERGAATIYAADSPRLASILGELAVPVVADAARQADAGIILVNRGGDVLEIVPRLAARLGGVSVNGAVEIPVVNGDVEAVAAVYGGAARARYRFSGSGPRVISPAPAIAGAPERTEGRMADVISLDLPDATTQRVRIVEPAAAPEGPRLADARVVVSGGRGLEDKENYGLVRELAAALGGLPGASRAIVDDGWATPAEQVGLTGTIVTPDLYVAAGISGASQHMAGCANARVLVAINRDPEAPIFKYAHYGIVDNCLDVLPELIRLLRERGPVGSGPEGRARS
jgi:electron transfer flavoprotein alpha subunit